MITKQKFCLLIALLSVYVQYKLTQFCFMEAIMFVVNYSDFVNRYFYNDFSISYMPGLRILDMSNAKVIVNVDSKSAFVYSE